MSYCGSDHWLSPFNARRLHGSRMRPVLRQFSAAPPLPPTPPPGSLTPEDGAAPRREKGTPAEYLLVSGTVGTNGTGGSLDPIFRITSRFGDPATGEDGSFCIVQRGGGGPFGPGDQDLSRFCFEPSFEELEDWFGSEENSALDEVLFSWKIEAAPDLGSVTLEHNGTELDRIDSSANAPTVNITSPQTGDVWDGGDQTITFPSKDPDGGPLTHIIYYSPDGGETWLPLDIDVPDQELTIDPSVIEGGPDTHVRVLTTDGVNTSMDEVGPIDVRQQPALQASMSEIDFRKAVLFQGSTRALELSNPGTGPLHITSVTSNNPEFMAVSPLVPFEVWPGEVRSLDLRFVPTSIGEQTATLTIDSDDAEKAILNIGLSGEGVESGVPDAEVSSNAIDFGAVAVGTPAERQVTLTNHGPAPLEVSAITSSDGQFTVVSPRAPLEVPVDAQVIVVRFLPGSVGAKAGMLTIATDDPDNPTIVIALNGIGLGGGAGPVPAINMGGVVNAASGGAVLVPGGLGSIFGINLAGATVAATSIPLPTTLGGGCK